MSSNTNTNAPLQNQNANVQPAVNNMSQPQPPSYLQKKGLLGGNKGNSMGSIVSPTDNVMSPCSAKLSSSKQRHFQKSVKPAGIASQLSKLAASNNANNGDKSKVDF